MKKIQLLSILVLSGAVLFGGKETAAAKAKVNFKESVVARAGSAGSVADLVIDSDKAIHGLQFDISYNHSEIKSIKPESVSGFEVKYNELSEGVVRGLIFSMQGHALPENLSFEFINTDGFEGSSTIEFKDIILADSKGNSVEVEALPENLSFEFINTDGFEGSSTIEFKDIILADSKGNSVEVEAQTYDINFSNSLLPVKTELTDAYPNPFNPSSTLNYGVATEGHVEIMVYDATGRLVEELVNQHQVAGYHSVTWNAAEQASGMYFAKMIAGDVVQTQKLVLLK